MPRSRRYDGFPVFLRLSSFPSLCSAWPTLEWTLQVLSASQMQDGSEERFAPAACYSYTLLRPPTLCRFLLISPRSPSTSSPRSALNPARLLPN